MTNKKKLGNGLQSLLGEAIGIEASEKTKKVSLSKIQPNQEQPRKDFNQDRMKTLIGSIKEHGVLQPIIVQAASAGGYKIIAGERRWRAAKELGLKDIPIIIKDVDKVKSLELALVENIQREDLNPIEKARAFVQLKNNFGLKQEQIASRVGQDRSSIANTIRLLDLPEDIQDCVSRGTLSMGHARALLSLKDPKKQKIVSERIITDGLSVRETELITSGKSEILPLSPKKHIGPKPASSNLNKPPHISDMEDKLREFIGAKVSIQEKNGCGKIIIGFSNTTQFENILGKFKTLKKH